MLAGMKTLSIASALITNNHTSTTKFNRLDRSNSSKHFFMHPLLDEYYYIIILHVFCLLTGKWSILGCGKSLPAVVKASTFSKNVWNSEDNHKAESKGKRETERNREREREREGGREGG